MIYERPWRAGTCAQGTALEQVPVPKRRKRQRRVLGKHSPLGKRKEAARDLMGVRLDLLATSFVWSRKVPATKTVWAQSVMCGH
jgi:hypothetical protein